MSGIHTWGVTPSLVFDDLARLYASLAVGIGALVAVYARGYLPLRRERPTVGRAQVPFFLLLLAFLGAMVGLAASADLVLLVWFFDLTALVSFALIAFEHEQEPARAAARSALRTTGLGSVALLAGAAWLAALNGTTALSTVLAGPAPPAALALIGAAAVAKSAQVPLHGWLPLAMAAPTPVSAYLHSAAMVAAGVFLLQRLHPLFAAQPALVAVGALSIGVGTAMAATRDGLKEVLAWSTIAQYGYVVVLLGLGDDEALAASRFYVFAHALAKSGLFLVAGAVTVATGAHALSEVRGLGRRRPVLAIMAAILAAGLAGLPLTVGFSRDDHFFAALAHTSPAHAALGVAAATGTFVYAGRWWTSIFLGPADDRPLAPLPASMVSPIGALASLVLIFGVWPAPAEALAGAHAAPEPAALAMAAGAWALGAALLASRARWEAPLARALDGLPTWAPLGRGLEVSSALLHTADVRSLRDRIAAVLVPTALLVGSAALAAGAPLRIGAIRQGDVPALVALALVGAAAIGCAAQRNHAPLVLAYGALGATLTLAFAVLGAPDVALACALLGNLTTLLLFAGLRLLPADLLAAQADRSRREHWRARDLGFGALATAGALALVWRVLSQPAAESVAWTYLALAPRLGSADAVSPVLADFRGLDTAGECTALLLAMLGFAQLLKRDDP